jgi:N-ethylmaleimide reductase
VRLRRGGCQENNQLPVAPSAIKINGESIHTPLGKQPYETPRALETDEISLVVEDYRKAAERAKMAGFDGVEIHGANGYLIDTFLQTKTNHRTDAYGGSVENCYRFLKEIVEAIITVFPPNRVGVRLTPNGIYNDMGSPSYREDFLYIAGQLNAYGLAYLHLVDGLAFGFHELGRPMMIGEFRDVFAGPLIGNCGYTQEQAETAARSKVADLIAFGRDFISNPDLVERFTNGWPLNPPAEVGVWYSFGPEGYIDFPTYQESQAIS